MKLETEERREWKKKKEGTALQEGGRVYGWRKG